MKKFPVIFCDMDEVLSDFVGGACKVHGITREELESKRPPGTWAIEQFIGLTTEEFWKPINALGERFWTELEPLPWCVPFFSSLQEYGEHVVILSSPSDHPGCLSGKAIWLRKMLGPNIDFCPFRYKHYLAGSKRILIDDRAENVDKWSSGSNNRGIGIVFPSQGNLFYKSANNPLPTVYRCLELDRQMYYPLEN